jgi:NADPH:quinone reductase
MREAHLHADTTATLHDVLIRPLHVLVKVVAAGCNLKDRKMPAGLLKTISDCPDSGDDVAGIIQAIPSEVYDFHVGDRVVTLHGLGALVHDWATFHVGEVGFEEAATVPLGALMARIGLLTMLWAANSPWESVEEGVERILVIYGAATTVGAYAVKLAKLMNIHPIICVADRGIPFVQTLIDERVVVVEHRKGNESVVKQIRDAMQGRKLEFAFDAVSDQDSLARSLRRVADAGSCYPQFGRKFLAYLGRCRRQRLVRSGR